MLTTRCPHCSTMFRIRPEQLTVRGGRVRCGHCQQAFSALNHLEEVDDEMVLPPNPVPPAKVPPAPPARPNPAPARPVLPPALAPLNASRGLAAELPPVAALPAVEKVAEAPLPAADSVPPAAPVVMPSLSTRSADAAEIAPGLVLKGPSPAEVRAEAHPEFEFDFDVSALANDADDVPEGHREPFIAEPAGAPPVTPPAAGQDAAAKPAPAAGPAKPYESKIAKELGIKAYDPEREVGFGQTLMLEEPVELTRMDLDDAPQHLPGDDGEMVAEAGPVEDRRSRRGAWKWAVGASVLGLLALAQGAYVFRTELARELPQLRAPLEQACAALACSVPYPREASDEKIKIESSEFFADGGGAGRYRLVATIANHVSYAQAWPSLELTITDRFDIAIARRVIPPQEWLPAAQRGEPAFEPHSEVAANIALDLDGLAASGYRLYVFYP